jgi:hypothetical protein
MKLLCMGVLLSLSGLAHAGSKPANVAFVLLSEASFPRGEELVSAYARFAPKGERLTVAPPKKAGKLPMLELSLSDGGSAVVALMPMPVPNGEADDAAKLSLSSQMMGWKLPPHKAQLVVTLKESKETRAFDHLSRLTSLVAAVTATSPSVGVYWGAGSVTHDPKLFLKLAENPKPIGRVNLWIGFSMAREPDGKTSVLSRGMEQLDLPDVLLIGPAKASVGNLIAPFFDLLMMTADEGKALPEGDTVGPTATDKWPVHYVQSPIDPSKKVCRIVIQ